MRLTLIDAGKLDAAFPFQQNNEERLGAGLEIRILIISDWGGLGLGLFPFPIGHRTTYINQPLSLIMKINRKLEAKERRNAIF